MSEFAPSRVSAEFVPETKSRSRKVMAGLAAIAALAASGYHARSASTAPPQTEHSPAKNLISYAPRMDLVAVSSNDPLSSDFQTAETAAAQIQETGANAVRLFLPDNQGQQRLGNYALELCNAIDADNQFDLITIVSVIGYDASQQMGELDESPIGTWDFTMYGDNIIRTMAHHCMPTDNEIYLEGPNEPNNPQFNSAMADPNLAPQQPVAYMLMMSKFYAAVKKEAALPGINANVTVIGGSLSAANNNPVGFLNGMAQAEASLGLSQPPFDILDVHPYPQSPTDNPAATMTNLYPQIKADFPNTPLWWGEIGVPAMPSIDQNEYQPPVTGNFVTETQQAQYIQSIFDTAACETGTVGVGIFHVWDKSGDGNLPSGIIYPHQAFKSSYKSVTGTLSSAANGSLTSCD